MFLECLELQNFRNYQALEIEFSPRVNIFFGQNAQGKTNLLEAVSLLSLGRSFRTKKETEMIMWGAEACYLRGDFRLPEEDVRIELGISGEEKRFKLDGQIVKNNQIFGKVPVITFAPDDLQLIKGGPQNRRDFLDLYLALIEPKYRFIFYNFYKVLQQRNRLFKEVRIDPNEMEAWNEQFIEKGSKVIKYRMLFIESVKPFIAEAHHQISGSSERLKLDYWCFSGDSSGLTDEEKVKERFRDELQTVKRNEIERRVSLVGPQRDDIRLIIGNDVDIRNFGSQGQQRTAALALKLGLVEKIKESRGQYPILLLDDVMSEFDDERKKYLLQMLIGSAQTFMTSTSQKDFPILAKEARFFEVAGGDARHVQ